MCRHRAVEPPYNERVHNVIMDVGRRGGSVNSMALACNVKKQTLRQWIKKHPEFAVTFDKAKQLSQIYYEELGKANLHNPAFRDAVWAKFIVRFADYRQSHKTVEHKHKDAVPAEIMRRVVTRSAPAAE